MTAPGAPAAPAAPTARDAPGASGDGPLRDGRLRHEIRVIFGDTDQMGVVYYANYLRYFEAARAAYWRALGRSYKDLERWGIALPVVEAHCEYRRPAHYEDVLGVEVWVSELRGASLRFAYRILRGDDLIAEGTTRHAVIGSDGRLRALPPALRASVPPVPVPSASPAGRR